MVIAYPALDGSPGLEVMVKDQAPVQVPSFSEMNKHLLKLGLATAYQPCSYFCDAIPCQEDACLLAAVGTLVWAGPGENHVLRMCDEHQAAELERLAGRDLPHVVLERVLKTAQDFYVSSHHEDMLSLTRLLVGEEVPAAVFLQPRCSRCKARICLPRGSLRWANAEGSFRCKGNGSHLPSASTEVQATPAAMAG
jgi:hypothetical protein